METRLALTMRALTSSLIPSLGQASKLAFHISLLSSPSLFTAQGADVIFFPSQEFILESYTFNVIGEFGIVAFQL